MNFQKPCLPTVDKLYGLVGELRNEIYKNVAADEQLLLRSTGTIEPHRLSTMYTAPPKIQSEYLSLALSYAKTIETTVHNFDFIHVAEFVGERPEEEVKTFLTTDNGRSKRHFIIYMKWTDDFPSALANLKRSRPWAKDPTIEFGYRLKFDHSFQFQVQHNKVQDDQVQDNQVRNDESERIELFHIANLRVKQFRRLSSGLRQEMLQTLNWSEPLEHFYFDRKSAKKLLCEREELAANFGGSGQPGRRHARRKHLEFYAQIDERWSRFTEDWRYADHINDFAF